MVVNFFISICTFLTFGLLFLISYQVEKPSMEDRDLFFGNMIQAAVSISDLVTKESPRSLSAPDLPKAPKVTSGPKASEVKAKFESEQHALRRLRMCLRDVCNRLVFYNVIHVYSCHCQLQLLKLPCVWSFKSVKTRVSLAYIYTSSPPYLALVVVHSALW